ncbi:MAG: hypothetical protein WED07_00095 [Candidatus Freyarchaeum deiterrae]
MSVHRPGGVLVIAIFFIIISSLGFLIEIGTIAYDPGYYSKILYYSFLLQTLKTYANTDLNRLLISLDILFLSPSMSSDLELTSIMPLAIFISEISSGLSIIAGVGLLYMRRLGRWLGLLSGVLLIFGGIIFIPLSITVIYQTMNTTSPIYLVGLIAIIFGALIVGYLKRGDVKTAFDRA